MDCATSSATTFKRAHACVRMAIRFETEAFTSCKASRDSLQQGERKKIMIRTIVPILLALSFIGGATSAMAVAENDNDRSTSNAKEFYEKLDQQRGN